MSDHPNLASNDLLDLRLLPSWLKEESSSAQSFANYEGEDHSRREGRDDRRGPRGRDQRNSGGAPRRGAPGGKPNPQGARSPQRDARRDDSPGSRRNDQRRESSPDRRQDNRPPRQEESPAPVEIYFFPETLALEKVTEQLRSAPIAYPLFGVAKMFLQRPERHQIQLKPLPEAKLFKLAGTSHLSTDRSRLETIAFRELGEKYFAVEVSELPEIKGNFTTVARSSLTGKVFGPTNHHTFQTGLHKEYEERFSRRMSFVDYQRSIETTKDPAAIEQWKNESRRIETYRLLEPGESLPEETLEKAEDAAASPEANTTEEVLDSATAESPELIDAPSPGEPQEASSELEEEIVAPAEVSDPAPISTGKIFASKQEAETYFRREILPSLIQETEVERLSGQEARNVVDRRLAAAVRAAWEAEARYPLGLVNAIRVKFNQQNLHIFKFKKRVLLISALKPVYLDDKSESLSPSIGTILRVIREQPGIDRKGLVEKIVNVDISAADDEKLRRKTSLISDLFWLVRQGNVIEFSDGTFDLPLGPKSVPVEPTVEVAITESTVPTLVDVSSSSSQEQ